MKLNNQILSAIFAVVMLFTTLPVGALSEGDFNIAATEGHMQTAFEDSAPALEDLPEPDELMLDTDEDLALTLDGTPVLAQDDNTAMNADPDGEIPVEGYEQQSESPVCANSYIDGDYDRHDFLINEDGVLTNYNGDGGDVTIPNGVTGIGKRAFAYCSRLTSVSIPDSVKSIGDSAFYYCDNLKKITIPNSVTYIGDEAFYYCYRMEGISIPNSVKSIGAHAFDTCYFTSITIPNSVTSIGDYAFNWCVYLAKVTIYAKKIIFGDSVFNMCHHPTIYTYADSDAYKWAENNSYAVDVVDITERLSKTFLSMKMGETQTLKIYYPTSKTVTWSTSDSHIATVVNGKVTAKKIGKCIINAQIMDGKKYTCKVNVTDPAKLSKASLSLNMGKKATLKVTGLVNRKVVWSTSNKKIATVQNGKVTAIKAGKCTITAQVKNGKKLTCKVTVTDPAKLSETALTISTIDSIKLTLKGGLKRTVSWFSSNSKVANITKSRNGYAMIKASKTGTATITAKVKNGKTLKCMVTVVNPLTLEVINLEETTIYNELDLKFINNSNKEIVYAKFEILQYNNRGDILESPRDYYYLNETVNPKNYIIMDNYWVNDDTKSVNLNIIEVTFSDGTNWKP